jgi:hypothetical protein
VPPPAEPLPPPPPRRGWVREAGRLALVFLLIAVADMLFILICLSFLSGTTLPPGR